MLEPMPSDGYKRPTLNRVLGPVEGTSIVVGTVIGSGIFVTPSTIAKSAGQFGFGTVLAVWVVCGLLSLAGALAFAELAAMFPRSGGQYVFLREAFGRKWAFLYGWMEFWVGRAGSIAALAVVFARYAADFAPLDEGGQRWIAFLAVFLLTVINYLGVRWGGAVQVLFTGTKVGALLALVVCAFGMAGGTPNNWLPLWTTPPAAGSQPGLLALLIPAIGLALIDVLWAYDGWANGALISEEMKEPQRNVPRALIWGTLAIMGIYLSANVAYQYVLPIETIRSSPRVAADAARALLGEVGGGLISAAVMVSTFGAVNGVLLTGPRIFYAMAQDEVFFRQMGDLHIRFRTPYWSILFQGLWSSLLILVPFDKLLHPIFPWLPEKPLFDQLITYVIFASWVFYGMSVAAVFILRKRRPDLPRPYRAWGYPVVPFLFVLVAVAFVAYTLVTQPRESLAGVVIVAAGLPAYARWHRRSSAAPNP